MFFDWRDVNVVTSYLQMYYQIILLLYFHGSVRDGGGIEVKVVTVHLPEAYLEAIDELVRKKIYPNRAEAIRMAVRDFIQAEANIREQ
ncbi:MAG: ribbon-helix-helix domain-containing protein [Nitrososphaerota archaeon]